MLSFDELQKKYKDQKPQTVAGPSTEDPLYIKYREAVEAERPKVAGGTVNPIISFGNVRENPVLKRKTNTTKTYSQALTESRNKAKVLENGAKLPTVIPPKGDVSKLILPDTGGGGTVNPTLKRNEVRTNYDYMTDKEAAVYKYYRDRGQVEKAQEYLDALEMDVNQRAAMQKREDAKKLAEESTAAALYARAVGNIGQAAGAVYAAAMEGADKPVDPYHPLMGGVNMNEGLYEGLMGQSTGANKVFKDIGLGIFDWGTQAALLGPATPYVMAAGAAAGNTKDALERGGTTDEAIMYGLAGGAAEAITEKLGYDRLFKYGANAIAKKLGHAGLFELSDKIADKGALAKFLWEVMPHGVSEGLEEATSEFTNIVADTLVLGDNSQMKQIAQTAMENGATESEAVKTALMEGIKQVGYSGAVGAASGGVIAGGVGGLSRAKGRNALEMAGNPAGVAREAMTNAGKEVTKRINDMRSQGKAEVPEGTTQGNVLPEQGNVLSNRENMLPEQGNVMVNRENVPEVTQKNKALRDFGEKYYYTEGQKVVNEEAERRGDTSFIPAFQTYYTAGLTGVKESDIKQTAETIVADKGLLSAAYLAGVNDRKTDLEARMKGTGKMGQTAGVFLETDAVTKEQRSLAELVSRVAELEVVLVDELPQDRRGYYENNKGRVTIALNSGQFAGTLFHEATHYIREANPEGYDRLRNAVFSAAAAMKGMDLESYTKKYEKMYGEAYKEAGQEVDYDMILEEMTADAFAEIAGDEKSMRTFVTKMQQTNPSVLEKIKEFLDNLLETLKGLVNDGRFSSFGGEIRKDIKTTEKFAKMLAEEMERAGEKQRGEKTSRVRQLNRVEGVRFSIREEEYEDLVEENEALKEANEALRRQFEITKDAVHDPVSAKEAVRKWLKAINSTYDVDIFTEKFLALADYVANAGDRVDFQKVMGALQKLAYDALSESKVLNKDLSDAYKDFKNDVRKTKIKVTEDMAEEFDYYGGYNTVRKENFGKINLSRQGGIYADVFYQEMAEKYPELLDVERVSTQVDAVMDILEVVESLQPIYENPYGMNLDEYAMDAAYDLWEMYFDIEMQKPTFADKYEKKVEQLQIENQKLKAAKNKMRQEMKERHEEQMEKAKAEANKKLEEEREKYIRQVDVLLEEKYKLRQKLETQWKAHKNSMVEAQRTELARLIAEGKKTAAEIRELKKDKEELKQRMDEVLEREDLWVQACQAILRENNKEINRYKKQVQRLKESKEKQRERAIRKYDRLLEEKFQREERRRKQREKNKYGKYKKIIDKERNTMEKWKTRGTDEKHIQEWMLPYVNVFIEKMNFDDPEKNFMPTDIQELQASYNKLNEEVGLVFEEEEETIKSLFADLTKTIGNGIQIAEFDAEDIRKLSVIFRSMTHMVRNGNRMVSIRTGERISDISNAYMKDMENKKTKKPDSRLRVLSDMMNVQMLDTESFFKEMGKTVHDTIYRGLREGFDRKIKHIKESVEFMQNTVDKKKIREWGEMEPKEYSVSSGKILLTDAQIMSLYCLNRREQAKGHIYQGGIKGEPVTQKVKGEKGKREIVRNTKPVIVTQEDVKRIIDKLTEEQKKVALAIQEFLEKAGMWGNEVTLEMFGYKKFNETNYFPIVTDENYIKTVYGARAVQNSTMQNAGTTKQTQKNANNPIILENIFDVFVRHTDFMSSYNAFVPALSDLNKFMNYREIVKKDYDLLFGENRSVKETMQRVMGPAGQRYIRELTERLNNPAVKEDVERLPRIFLRNMKIASVGANLRVIIQQPVSYLRAADEIGVGYLMGALVPSKTDFEKVYEYAPIAQWKEWGNYEMNVGRTMKELLIGQNFYERFLEKSMIAASAMDKLTWGRIWRAAELEVKKKHPELTGNRYYETVGERFSEIIDGTQVVDSILHRNQMMRSTSLYSQMFTSFMSEPTKTYNMMRNSMVAVIKDNTPENRKKVVRTFMTLVANGVCVAAAAGLVDMLRDDDDDETLLEKWLQAFRGDFSEAESVSDYILAAIGSNLGNSFNPLGYIPYMRDIFSVIQGYTVQRTDISWLNDLVKSGKNLMRYMSGESNYTLNAVLMDAAGSLSKATGIPINSAKRDILAIKNTIVNYTLGLDAQYENQKLTYDVGSEKNINMYVKMMLEAKMSGNEQIATRIYNDMVNGGISNEKIDNKIKTEQVKAIKEEPEAMEAAKAYNEGRVDDYTRNVEALAKKGYFMENIESAMESLTKPPKEDEETFETITKDYWKEEGEVESADYALLFNAYMNGNMADYEKMWSILNAAGKEDNSIRSSMRSRLKSEYWKAKEAGDSQRMQRAAEEFYRLGGKRETLEKAPQ